MTGWHIYFIWLAIASTITFLFYGYDKVQAKRSGRRVPEKYLHWMALAGGFPGSWLGRSVFRYKTRKGVFLFVLILSTIVRLVLAGWLFFISLTSRLTSIHLHRLHVPLSCVLLTHAGT
ncbi:MAG TPA: DUF1294 domain-containing protein [Dehalococcoidia bacterium]|nr:DUF1294 domain-containing protein [Dehalococcoidia bacterium]